MHTYNGNVLALLRFFVCRIVGAIYQNTNTDGGKSEESEEGYGDKPEVVNVFRGAGYVDKTLGNNLRYNAPLKQ